MAPPCRARYFSCIHPSGQVEIVGALGVSLDDDGYVQVDPTTCGDVHSRHLCGGRSDLANASRHHRSGVRRSSSRGAEPRAHGRACRERRVVTGHREPGQAFEAAGLVAHPRERHLQAAGVAPVARQSGHSPRSWTTACRMEADHDPSIAIEEVSSAGRHATRPQPSHTK